MSAVYHTPVGWFVPDRSGLAAQHRVLVPEYQRLSLFGQVLAEQQDHEAEYPAD